MINTHVPPKTTPEARSLMKYYWKEISARNELYCGSPRGHKLSAASTDEDNAASYNQFIAVADSSNNEVDEEERLISFLDDVGLTIDSGVGLQVDSANNDEWKDVRGWHAASVCSKIFGSCEKLEDTAMLSKKIETLCTWATTAERSGDWRAYFIASVLSHYINGAANTDAEKMESESHTPDNTLDKQQRKLTVQESLMRFLDHSDVHDNEKLPDDALQMDVDHGEFVPFKNILASHNCVFDSLLISYSLQSHHLK